MDIINTSEYELEVFVYFNISIKPFYADPIEGSSPQIFNPPFVYSLQISADGQWIAAGLGDGSIQLQHQGPSKEKSKGKRTIGKRLYDGHNHLVNCL